MAHIEIITPNPTPAPEWLKDAVIYELNPKTFTSPHGDGEGDGSGTFHSLEKKLNYIKELGVNTLWLAGHTCGSRHFSEFWTVYACRDPRNPDPSLGTPSELKQLIASAHELGLRVIGEVVTHGVTYDSLLIQEHPDWFKGSEWGMADYDYTNPSFLKFWKELWVNTTLDYGFDGWRLDGPNGAASFKDVLTVWDSISHTCCRAGHPIAIIGENSRYHIRQCDYEHFSHDPAAEFSPEPRFATMQISCHDEGIHMRSGNYYVLRGSRFKFGYCSVFSYNIPLFLAGEEFDTEPLPVMRIKSKIYDGFESSREITFYDTCSKDTTGGWLLGSRIDWNLLRRPHNHEMLEDCKKILHIRNSNKDIFHYDRAATHILPAPCSPKSSSVPYLRYIPGRSCILVVGNDAPFDRKFLIHIPLEQMNMHSDTCYKVTNLFTDNTQILPGSSLMCLEVFVKADYTPGGGVTCLRIDSNLDEGYTDSQ